MSTTMLPVQILKLRYLLHHISFLKENDADYIKEISKILGDSNDLKAHPITVILLDSFYDVYKPIIKGAKNVR